VILIQRDALDCLLSPNLVIVAAWFEFADSVEHSGIATIWLDNHSE
jgi:hypothetical protein